MNKRRLLKQSLIGDILYWFSRVNHSSWSFNEVFGIEFQGAQRCVKIVLHRLIFVEGQLSSSPSSIDSIDSGSLHRVPSEWTVVLRFRQGEISLHTSGENAWISHRSVSCFGQRSTMIERTHGCVRKIRRTDLVSFVNWYENLETYRLALACDAERHALP